MVRVGSIELEQDPARALADLCLEIRPTRGDGGSDIFRRVLHIKRLGVLFFSLYEIRISIVVIKILYQSNELTVIYVISVIRLTDNHNISFVD